mgnify:CR=1 FL=1
MNILPNQPMVTASRYMVVAGHYLAAEAGIKMLEAGGNAIDAGVAAGIALGVVHSDQVQFSGVAPMLIYVAEQDRVVSLAGVGYWPKSASLQYFIEKHKGCLPLGLLRTVVPAAPDAWITALQRFGTMPFGEVVGPAIKFAREGIPVHPVMAHYLNQYKDNYASWPSNASIWLKNGQAPVVGDLLVQTDLASTLQYMADEENAASGKGRAAALEAARNAFYEGDIAKAMVKEVQNNGGIWTLNDLAHYDVAEREPVTFNYRDHKMTSGSLPSSGGLVMAGIFGQLDKYNYHDASEADRAHLFIEAMRNAYYQRANFMGDADFTHDTGEWLMQPSSIDAMASTIRLDKARPSSEMPLISDGTSGTQTTHFSVIDGKGNRAAVTLSLNAYFGSGFTAKGTGVLLNNEMDDFSAKPGEPNAYGLVGSEANKIEPGKRPLSSMTPSFLEGPKGVHVLGTPGGSRIISMVSQGMLDAIDGKSAKEIVAKGRIHHQYLPDVVEHEAGAIDSRIKENLESRGHTFKQTPNPYGNLQVVHWDKANQVMNSAADPRREGLALVGQSIA